MRFIVDESTGRSVVTQLRAMGHDVLAVAEEMPEGEDRDVLQQAADQERILITNDKDFGELIYRLGRGHAGVLLLRLRDDGKANRIRVVSAVISQYGDRLSGHFIVATEKRVRIRST